jgi:WhiB family redox-sensing transcriptional regulator
MNPRLDPRMWDEFAACEGSDTELFYPPRIKHKYEEVAAQARAFCFGESAKEGAPSRPACPVRKRCLEWAIETDELHGIFGGLSHRERNALKRKAKRQKKTVQQYIEDMK